MSEWKPIETLPKRGGRVLLFIPPYGAGSGHYDVGYREWVGHFVLNRDAKPTHWMPLPEPPSISVTGLGPKSLGPKEQNDE